MKRILLSVLMVTGLASVADARPPARHERVMAPIQFEPQKGAKMEVSVPTKTGDQPVNLYVTRSQTHLKQGIQSRLTSKDDPLFMSAADFRALAGRQEFRLPKLQSVDDGKSRVVAADDFVAIRNKDGTTLVRVEWPRDVGAIDTSAAMMNAYNGLVASSSGAKWFPEKLVWKDNRWQLRFSNGESIPLVKDQPTQRALPITPAAKPRRLARGRPHANAL